MADHDPAEVRAVLRGHGIDVPARGRLSADAIAEYERISGQNGQPEPEPGEYDAGISAADFPPDDEPEPEPAAPVAERRPRRVRQSRPSVVDRVRAAGKTRGKGRAKRRHPRVPVDRLTGDLWGLLGRVIGSAIPPTGKCMEWQAPVAGLIFEDMIRDTVADRALQPVARAEQTARKGAAILGLPAVITAIASAQGLPEDQRAVRMAFLLPLAREAVILNLKIMGDKAEEIEQSQAETGAMNEQAMRIIAGWFPPPPEPAEPEPAATMAGV